MATPTKDNDWDIQSPEVKRMLAAERYDDCLSCRIMGKWIDRLGPISGLFGSLLRVSAKPSFSQMQFTNI
ncbi:uncharacterized protein BJX67DRAFT_355338 [Aspergillus lucknowensis]|uniref:DUF4536 domain-containing protein n=1 Tax=Aspergillus lucknowensis TaxID=176173 RepID=A0ABR4LTA1_9EURO